MNRAAILLVLAVAVLARAAELIPPGAPNCSLQAPPQSALKKPFHGGEFAGFPNKPGARYTGCLWLWMNSEPMHMIYFESGDALVQREFQGPQSVTTCRYSEGKLIERTVVGKPGGECSESSKLLSTLLE